MLPARRVNVSEIMRNIFKRKTIRLAEFIYAYCNSSKRGDAYKRTYRNIARIIESFENHTGQDIMTDSFNETMTEKYLHYLRASKSRKNEKHYTLQTVKAYVEKTVSAINKAERAGYIVCKVGFSECIIPSDDCQSVYLSLDELDRINTLSLHGTSAQVRDIFLIGCFTGLRYSDYSRLSEANFIDDTITILTKKTKTWVSVPVHQTVRQIIERNKGYDFLRYTKSQQSFSKLLKQICKKAGMVEPVLIERMEGYDIVRQSRPKYILVATHTARRSAATNMYLAGIPTFRIMLITGHKTEASFFKYIRISKIENSKTLQKHPFFSS